MPDQQPIPISIDPIHATRFSVNVPFYVNQVDVNVALRRLEDAVGQLQEQVRRLQDRVALLEG